MLKQLAIAFLLAPCMALGATLNFENMPKVELADVGWHVSASGFALAYTAAPDEQWPTGFYSVGPTWPYNKAGLGGTRTTALTANSCSAQIVLTQENNLPFRLTSIDVSGLNGDAFEVNGRTVVKVYPVDVTFTGNTFAGGRVTARMRTQPGQGWGRINFGPGFRNLRNVVWYQGNCATQPVHMFDNVVAVQ